MNISKFYLTASSITVTKGIVDLHGGKISVSSEGEGHGSTFTVELPVYKRRRMLHRDGSVKSLFSVDRNVNLEQSNSLPPHNAASSVRPSISRKSSSVSSRSSFRKMMSMDSDGYFWEGDYQLGKPRPGNGGLSLVTPLAVPSTIFTIQESNEHEIRSSVITSPDLSEMMAAGAKNRLSLQSTDCILLPVEALRVLIVDDAAVNRKMLARLIISRCDVTMEAEDGQRAVEEVASAMAREEPFNCILMDFNMPRKDGPTAAREIRSLGYTGIIIGITGCTTPAEKELFVSSGANCVLTKPVDLMELDRTILGTSVILVIFKQISSSFIFGRVLSFSTRILMEDSEGFVAKLRVRNLCGVIYFENYLF